MEHYAAIDVSLEWSSVCVVDATGKVLREAKVASDPEALVGFFRENGLIPARVVVDLFPSIAPALPRQLGETGHRQCGPV